MPECPNCKNILTATERRGTSCPVCGTAFADAPSAELPHQTNKPSSIDAKPSKRCVICDAEHDTDLRAVQLSNRVLQGAYWVTLRSSIICPCCRPCEGRLRRFHRIRALYFPVLAVTAIALFAAYIALLPFLSAINLPGAVLGAGFLIPAMGTHLLTSLFVRGLSGSLLSSRAIAEFEATGIGWNIGPRSDLAVSDLLEALSATQRR